MPSWNDPSFEAKDCAQRFARFDVQLPADAQRWHQRLLELKESRPEAPPHGHVAGLIADGADQADIDKAVAQQVGQSFRRQEHGEAEKICGRRVLASVHEHRDDLHSELARIATDLITKLHAAAALTEDITELAREKRTEEAALLANAATYAATLKDLYQLRDGYLVLPGEQWSTGSYSCQQWENPWDFNETDSPDGTLWGLTRANIKAGGRLAFMSVEEAHAASEQNELREVEPIDPHRSNSAIFAGG